MAEHQRSLHLAIEQINSEIAFVAHKVTSNFSSFSCFSALDLRLAAHVHVDKTGEQRRVGIRVKDLFKVEAVLDTSALEFIAHSRRKIWPPFNSYPTKRKETEVNRTEVMLLLCKEIFVPLCNEVILESRYTTRIFQIPELQVGDIGLGSVHTWHGTSDARINGMEVVWWEDSGETFTTVEEVVSEDEGSAQSDGASTMVE